MFLRHSLQFRGFCPMAVSARQLSIWTFHFRAEIRAVSQSSNLRHLKLPICHSSTVAGAVSASRSQTQLRWRSIVFSFDSLSQTTNRLAWRSSLWVRLTMALERRLWAKLVMISARRVKICQFSPKGGELIRRPRPRSSGNILATHHLPISFLQGNR